MSLTSLLPTTQSSQSSQSTQTASPLRYKWVVTVDICEHEFTYEIEANDDEALNPDYGHVAAIKLALNVSMQVRYTNVRILRETLRYEPAFYRYSWSANTWFGHANNGALYDGDYKRTFTEDDYFNDLNDLNEGEGN